MNKPSRTSQLSRRQVMIGAAGLSFALVARPADGAMLGAERTGQAMSPWISSSQPPPSANTGSSGATSSLRPTGSRPSIARRNMRGAPVAHACGLQAVG